MSERAWWREPRTFTEGFCVGMVLTHIGAAVGVAVYALAWWLS